MSLNTNIIGEVLTFNNQDEPYRVFIKINSNDEKFLEKLMKVSGNYAIFIKENRVIKRFLNFSRYKVKLVDYHSAKLHSVDPLFDYTHLFKIELSQEESTSDVIIRSFKSPDDAHFIKEKIIAILQKFVENQKQIFEEMNY